MPHKGWYTGYLRDIGAVAAAPPVELDAEKTQHALASRLANRGNPAAEHLAQPDQTIFVVIRRARGVFSALLAARGITAPREAFEGRFGFYNLYQQGDAAALFASSAHLPAHGDGDQEIPSCACANHTAIEAALYLVRGHEVAPADAAAVEVTISPYVDRLVGAPFSPPPIRRSPRSSASNIRSHARSCADG